MGIIDAHAHLMDAAGYLAGLLKTMDACGIEKVCLSGLGPLFGMVDNSAIRQALREHPDRIIGAYYIRPGVNGPEEIDQARDKGFRMIKVTLPRVPYDDPACFPLWERALEHKMPVLFHTGIVAPFVKGHGEGISSWHMHPMRVEPITREFPELSVIVAHLGVSWNMDAAELARMRPNLYVDVTGEPGGWRERAKATGLDHWLWWPGAFDKVIFGTDVHYSKIKQILDEDLAEYARLGIGQATRQRIFGGTIRKLLGNPK